MGLDGRSQRNFPKHWTGLSALGTSQATAFLLDNGVYHEFTTVGSGQGCVLPVPVELPREITISNNGANALLVYPQVGGKIDNGTANASVSVTAGSSVTYWPTSFTNWQSRVTGGSGGGGTSISLTTTGSSGAATLTGGVLNVPVYSGAGSISEVSQTASFTAAAGAFYAISGSANVTATLPTAAGIAGQTIRIRCVSGYTGACTIASTGGQTIGPASATSQIIYTGESPLLQSDGTNWVRSGGLIIPAVCQLYAGSTQSLVDSTATPILLNTVVYDNTGQMAIAASNQIKIPRPGRYRVGFAATVGILASQAYTMFVSCSSTGATSPPTVENSFGASPAAFPWYAQISGGGTIVSAAGDLLTLSVYQKNTAASAETVQNGNQTMLEVTEIPAW